LYISVTKIKYLPILCCSPFTQIHKTPNPYNLRGISASACNFLLIQWQSQRTTLLITSLIKLIKTGSRNPESRGTRPLKGSVTFALISSFFHFISHVTYNFDAYMSIFALLFLCTNRWILTFWGTRGTRGSITRRMVNLQPKSRYWTSSWLFLVIFFIILYFSFCFHSQDSNIRLVLVWFYISRIRKMIFWTCRTNCLVIMKIETIFGGLNAWMWLALLK
jgi:hypothetical protein